MALSKLVDCIKELEKKNSLHIAIAYILIAYFFHAV